VEEGEKMQLDVHSPSGYPLYPFSISLLLTASPLFDCSLPFTTSPRYKLPSLVGVGVSSAVTLSQQVE